MPRTACRPTGTRLYHVERAKGGIALTMTAGSAVVSPDSPPAFGNLHAWDDAIVPWLKRLVDDCHGHGAAVDDPADASGPAQPASPPGAMVAGASPPRRSGRRRTAPSPKEAEDWDIARIVADLRRRRPADYAGGRPRRDRDRGLRPPGRQLSGRPPPIAGPTPMAAAWRTAPVFVREVLAAIRVAVGPDFIVGIRMVADEDWDSRPVAGGGRGDRRGAGRDRPRSTSST